MTEDKQQSLKQIIEARTEKLKRLEELGITPYPYSYHVSHVTEEILSGYDKLSGKTVSIAGRIISIRRMGKASFCHVQDSLGKMQAYIKQDIVGQKAYELFKLLDLGDIVGISGEVFRTKSGEISVSCAELTLLAKSLRPLPGAKEKEGSTFHAFADKEQRYRNRYLDLIVNPEVRGTFIKRAKIITALRSFLDGEGFVEVETPVLQPLYGGASARPFKTRHNTLDQELYLRIADELYLKRLIIGGYDGVYELSKVFRNEGMDRNHNPEFTMLEFYKAYVDYLFLMDFTENLIRVAAKSIGVKIVAVGESEVDLTKPFSRKSYMDLLAGAVGEDLTDADEKHLKSLCREKGIELESDAHLGRMYEVLMRELVEPELIAPTFVIDYPKAISPLAKIRRDGNSAVVERFELFINGAEFANAFSELNDPIDQRQRLEAQADLREKGDEEAQTLDEDFLRAVESGMPPTGGVGIGIDRLVMFLTGQKTIKDVILFPAMRPVADE